MFKKSILIILVALSGNNIHGVSNEQRSFVDLNKQEKEHIPQSRVSYTLINVLSLSAAYVAVTYLNENNESWVQTATAQYLVYLGLITTTGSLIADGMNRLREEEKEKREHEQYMSNLKKELLMLQSK